MSKITAYDEIIDFIAAGNTPESVIKFSTSDETKARVWELIKRSKESTLAPGEKNELDCYMVLEHIMRLAKAKALGILASQKQL